MHFISVHTKKYTGRFKQIENVYVCVFMWVGEWMTKEWNVT